MCVCVKTTQTREQKKMKQICVTNEHSHLFACTQLELRENEQKKWRRKNFNRQQSANLEQMNISPNLFESVNITNCYELVGNEENFHKNKHSTRTQLSKNRTGTLNSNYKNKQSHKETSTSQTLHRRRDRVKKKRKLVHRNFFKFFSFYSKMDHLMMMMLMMMIYWFIFVESAVGSRQRSHRESEIFVECH